ncbi:hypothetical protein F443_21149 [Phytophthora nicotianae P1569]|uniref:Uncharacterized protein n=1 Tax=Phytophthora nicotianae P1569 TaxID=1317065 RepID=V9E0A4_PHYNI|nr:hypothetical protein F443_21149 [Phytophthora nicotianae P1569]
MLKWLAAGPVVCEGLKKGLLYGNLLSDAAGGGSMEVLEYVCNLSLTDNSGEALVDLAKRPGPSSPLASVYDSERRKLQRVYLGILLEVVVAQESQIHRGGCGFMELERGETDTTTVKCVARLGHWQQRRGEDAAPAPPLGAAS